MVRIAELSVRIVMIDVPLTEVTFPGVVIVIASSADSLCTNELSESSATLPRSLSTSPLAQPTNNEIIPQKNSSLLSSTFPSPSVRQLRQHAREPTDYRRTARQNSILGSNPDNRNLYKVRVSDFARMVPIYRHLDVFRFYD
jgi:hypothetical protein